MMTTAQLWDAFDLWFEEEGHWRFGLGSWGRQRAADAWRERGIFELPPYPGPRPDEVSNSPTEGEER